MSQTKADIRKQLRRILAGMTDDDRRAKSRLACALLADSPEFRAARVVMIYLSLPTELDTSPLALRAWQEGKTVVAPRIGWDQRRLMPVEIASLHDPMSVGDFGVREPAQGAPLPVSMIDLVLVPGLGFTPAGHRIGRGMGFYDRFLSQSDFVGLACGLAFEDQVVQSLPVLDHDVRLGMLVTDRGIRRFSSNPIR
jgi:5-formyltetrahydrofolate cyclo-ligase